MSTEEKAPIVVNGKRYILWEQFVHQADEWIGGKLQEDGEDATVITDVTLEPNGIDSATFSIAGKDYSCSFDVAYGGVGAPRNGPGLQFYGGMGLSFYAEKKGYCK